MTLFKKIIALQCYLIILSLFIFITTLPVGATNDSKPTRDPETIAQSFVSMATGDKEEREKALQHIENKWSLNLSPMVIETVYLSRNPMTRLNLIELLKDKSGEDFGYDLDKWYAWIWQQSWDEHPEYSNFKSLLYRLIDPHFADYFDEQPKSTIRLDEVRWGGVRQDGIPPLRSPKMIEGISANYLEGDNIIFGIEVNGEARAYPKRILGWHEMFTDRVGDTEVAGVYCTLCGTMILYKTELNGTHHEVGTSGFLYRSNKLMYDKATQSLWSTLRGEPVIGPLTGKGITLERLSVVTTTWSEWLKRHPETLVLSIDTGFQRDYGEGAPYRQYFATDELMFTVPKLDRRLKNKDDVLGLLFPHAPEKPIAISSKFLLGSPLYALEVDGVNYIVLTDSSGAHRVYESKQFTFSSWDQDRMLTDREGNNWILEESKIKSEKGDTLLRHPSHNAFWFGWFSAFSHTRLIH